MPNLVAISQTVAENDDLSILQNGGCPPSWICCRRVLATYK